MTRILHYILVVNLLYLPYLKCRVCTVYCTSQSMKTGAGVIRALYIAANEDWRRCDTVLHRSQ